MLDYLQDKFESKTLRLDENTGAGVLRRAVILADTEAFALLTMSVFESKVFLSLFSVTFLYTKYLTLLNLQILQSVTCDSETFLSFYCTPK